MKTKQFPQKLMLNKSTISNLEKEQLGNARGGFGVTDISCPASECGITCADSCILCNEPKPSIWSPCYTDDCPTIYSPCE